MPINIAALKQAVVKLNIRLNRLLLLIEQVESGVISEQILKDALNVLVIDMGPEMTKTQVLIEAG